MTLTVLDVRHVANLARLAVTDESAERLTIELNGILVHMEELEAVDTEGVEPAAGIGARSLPLRSDASLAIAMARPLAEIAPQFRDGLLLVPRLASHDEPKET